MLLRAGPHVFGEDHGPVLHLPLRKGRLPVRQDRHGPHGRVIANEDRERRAAGFTRQHQEAEGYGELPGEEARDGAAREGTEDAEPDLYGEEVEQDGSERLRLDGRSCGGLFAFDDVGMLGRDAGVFWRGLCV